MCESWGCGSNTSFLNEYPIEALNLDGEVSPENFRIVKMSDPDSGLDHDIDIINGEFVATGPDGEIARTGPDLEGTSFKVERISSEGAIEAFTITIDRIGVVLTWSQRSRSRYVLAYKLTVSPPPLDTNKPPLVCREADVFGERDSRGKSWPVYDGQDRIEGDRIAIDGIWVPVIRDTDQYAILVKGETYDGNDATVNRRADTGQGKRWFNIACPRTALAKMKLMGYDPEEPAGSTHYTTPGQRQAVLKMITARYCGEMSFTEPGVPLAWQDPNRSFDNLPTDTIEALWTASGAKCLNEPRRHAIDWTRSCVTAVCSDIPRCDAMDVTVDSIPAPTGEEIVSVLPCP